MDPRLLRMYNEELTYLREAAREFGEENEVVAGYLGLKTPNDPDPYVERLLEGVAFLSARVNLKLQDQFPEFTQHLLQAVQPSYLAPTPSICVVGLDPKQGDPALMEGVSVPRNTELTAAVPDHDSQVRFRTGSEVQLLALEIEQAEYLPTRSAVAPYAAALGLSAQAGLRIRFRAPQGATLANIAPDALPIHLTGAESAPGELYQQLLGDCIGVVGQPDGADVTSFTLPKPQPHGFGEEDALLPNDGRAFRGYRLLAEYFACPERFLFVSLRELGKGFAQSKRHLDVVFLFNRAAPSLSGAISPDNLQLFATPAINLFSMQLGRIAISPYEHEFLLTPDRTRPMDFEVFRVLEVKAHGRTGPGRPTAPLYAFGAMLYDRRNALFYTTRVRLRRMSTREQRMRRRSDYVGSETFISLTTPGLPDGLADVRELAVRALVTNREMPEMIRFGGKNPGFSMIGPALKAIHVHKAPTRPRAPLALSNTLAGERGDAAWRVIGHLTPNYSSLIEGSAGDASALRDHLALYGRADDPAMRRQIDSILSVHAEPVTRRIPDGQGFGFARGRRVRIKLDQPAFENSRMYLFAAVVDRFLSEFASVNSFIETVFESSEQGDFAQWPPRTGLRPTI